MNTLELPDGILINMDEVILIRDTTIYMTGGFQIKLYLEGHTRSIKDCFHNIMGKNVSIKYTEGPSEGTYYVEDKVAFQDEYVDANGNWWNKSIHVICIDYIKTTIVDGQKNIDYLDADYERKFGPITAGNCTKFEDINDLVKIYADYDIYINDILNCVAKKAYVGKQYDTAVDLTEDTEP